MKEVLFLLIGLILTTVLIPIVRKISPNMGYMDRPEGESESKDTKDEARLIKEMVGDDKFVLVTSASHMPRSVMA